MTDLPANVYRVKQRDFTAIPREPWVYWIPDDLRNLFETLPTLGDVAQPRQGLATAYNFRFLRGWWEVGCERIAFGCQDGEEAKETGKRWFPYMKGGGYRKWYGNQDFVINWGNNGFEIDNFDRAVIRNPDYYFREGVTWSDVSSKGFGVRYLPPGFVFDVKGSSGFPATEQLLSVLSVMNSPWIGFALALLNPTVSFQVGDISRVPFKQPNAPQRERLEELTRSAVRIRQWESKVDENTFDFITPLCWKDGLENVVAAEARLADLEHQIDNEVYRLYGITDADRAAIEAELAGEPPPTDEDEIEAILNDDDDDEIEPPMDREELAVRWISYAVGVVLGRFRPGVPGALGSGVYRREDFAVGSLPAPDEAEFDTLVGPPERFAYVDEHGGRHVFPAAVESALCDLAVDDGITVLDEGHPRDLPALVRQALTLMLDVKRKDVKRKAETEKDEHVLRFTHHATPNTDAVIEAGADGDLRQFLSKDFFTQWHIKWYSIPYQAKAPVYWPLQSADRSYGFVLFHEKIDETTLYVLQRDYLDYKLNGLRQRIDDLTARMEGLEGSAQKRVARQIQDLNETLEEVEAFAKTMARVVREGYEPEPNWIDDRVILRMAPLWELIPLWEKYPKKHWRRLQEGEYDWSHIAMNYWPERVREACKENKSYAIAHGHPEWYEGD
jgi:hypothetical protein